MSAIKNGEEIQDKDIGRRGQITNPGNKTTISIMSVVARSI